MPSCTWGVGAAVTQQGAGQGCEWSAFQVSPDGVRLFPQLLDSWLLMAFLASITLPPLENGEEVIFVCWTKHQHNGYCCLHLCLEITVEFEEMPLEVNIKTHPLISWNTSCGQVRISVQRTQPSPGSLHPGPLLHVSEGGTGTGTGQTVPASSLVLTMQSSAPSLVSAAPFLSGHSSLTIASSCVQEHWNAFCWMMFSAACLYFCSTANTDGFIVTVLCISSARARCSSKELGNLLHRLGEGRMVLYLPRGTTRGEPWHDWTGGV